jgi:hypothetical protein
MGKANMEPSLNRAPPVSLERLITRVMPPAAREEVAGDLWERFRSSWRYVGEAAVTLPFVVVSQMRRATSGPKLMLEAFILFATLGGFHAAWLTTGSVSAWQRALPPTLAGLAALLLRDAYRTTDRWTARRALWDIVAVTLAIAVSQACVGLLASLGAISPDWRLPSLWLYGGIFGGLMMLFILRTGVDLVSATPSGALGSPNTQELEADYLHFQANVRFKNWTENTALAILVALGCWLDLGARPIVAAIGFAWNGLTLALMAYNLTRGRPKPLPSSLELPDIASFYRSELERQRRAIRFVWWWYFVPLYAGLVTNLITPGLRDNRPLLTATGVGSLALLMATIAHVNRARRRQLEDKIAELSAIAR